MDEHPLDAEDLMQLFALPESLFNDALESTCGPEDLPKVPFARVHSLDLDPSLLARGT